MSRVASTASQPELEQQSDLRATRLAAVVERVGGADSTCATGAFGRPASSQAVTAPLFTASGAILPRRAATDAELSLAVAA